MRILLAGGGTGGHLMPALNLADAIRDLRPDIEPVLVGARRGVEAALLPHRTPAYRYHLLPAEPIYRRQWWNNVRWVGLLPRLYTACVRIIKEEQPALAVGTGGYASGPILWVASGRNVPIALQEQNAAPGLTTRWLAARAAQIHLGFQESRGYLRPGMRTTIHFLGNPISPPRDRVTGRDEARSELGFDASQQVCFVMGGSQGAQAINETVSAALEAGYLADIAILWSTGPGMFDRFKHHHAPPWRHVRPFWDPVTLAYAAADLVVARAGAMTTAELCAWGLPSLLVPLPTAAAGHQATNARALAEAGCAVAIPQSEMRPESLSGTISSLIVDRARLSEMSAAATARGRPDAAAQIAETLLSLVD